MKKLRNLLPYYRPYLRGTVIGLALVVVSNLFTIAGPYFLKVAIDSLQEAPSYATVVRYALLIVLVALLAGASRYGMRELLNGISRRIETDLRNDIFAHLLRLPAEFYDQWRTGDLMSRATNDVLAVRQVAGPAIMYLVNTTTVSLLALGLMLWIDPRLTLVAMIPLAALPPAVLVFGKQIHERFERIQDQFSAISSFAQENLASIRIVKAYTGEDRQSRAFAALNEEYLGRNMALARVWGAFYPSLMLLSGLGAVVVLWYGGHEVMVGAITLGDFVAFGFYLTLLSWPMIALGWVTNLFQRGTASLARIDEMLSTPPAVADPEPKRQRGPLIRTAVRGAIEFDGVSFRYPGTERWVLRDLSLRIEPGETVALVGATGSGKSTAVRLIPRLYDVSIGAVRLDGVDVRDLPLSELRGAISVVPQETFLFSQSLRRNIALRKGHRDGSRPASSVDGRERIENAVQIAQLKETLALLPHGLDTRLGERGIDLSGGQKQRATLARAIYRNTPVLLLDDALSAVDTVTETAILAGLRGFMGQRTSLIVSHRVSAVAGADRIFVLVDGRLAESGTHEELVRRGEAYAVLLERQLLAEELERQTEAAPGGA